MSISSDKRYSIFLYAGFGLLLVVFIFLAVFYFKQIITANEELREVTTNNDVQLRAAMNMRVAVRERAILLWHMSFQEDIFERDELFLKFNILGSRFGHARTEYLTILQTETEKYLFAELDKETNSRAPALREFARLLMDEEEEKSYFSHLNQALTDQVVVSDILDKIIHLQQTQNEDARERTAEITSDIIYQLIIWMLIFIMAVIMFARVVVNVANKQSRRLSIVNDELNEMARHDHLTNLPNRLFLLEHLEMTLSHAKRHGANGALLYIDLDDFKPINDNYGHDVGDTYLQAISHASKKLLRGSDVLVRLGGDEFVVVFYEVLAEEDAIAVAEKLLRTLSSDYTIDDITVSASASIGICFFPEEDMTVDSLLSTADSVMYKAKQSGKNNYVVFRTLDQVKQLQENYVK